MNKITATMIFMISLIISGCGPIILPPKSYNNSGDVKVRLDSDIKGKISHIFIYKMDNKCEGDLKGAVELGKGPKEFTIPANELYFLNVEYYRYETYYDGTTTHVTRLSTADGTLLKAKKGEAYTIDAMYDEGFYNTELYKIDSKTGKKTQQEFVPIDACEPQ